MQRDHLFAPQNTAFQYIGLVDRANLVPPRSRQLEGSTRDSTNLVCRVLLGVEPAALPVGQRLDAARFTKIDAAREFADDDEVHVSENEIGRASCRERV